MSALIRLTQREGGFAAVLRRGDEGAGAILIQTLEKGGFSGLWERMPDAGTRLKWTRLKPQALENNDEIQAYLERRVKTDSDIWLIELDIADSARFIAESLPAG